MSETDKVGAVAAIFRQTGRAHHKAHADTDGRHSEWPLWYAEHAHESLKSALDAEFSMSELVYLILSAHHEQSRRAPGADWALFYGRFFADRYGV